MISTTDPRTGLATETGIRASTAADVVDAVRRAAATRTALAELGRAGRARVLRTIAAELERRRDDLVPIAEAETGLATARLEGEVARSAGQFRLFAEVIEDGAYLEAAIDTAVDSPAGRLPDVRRMLVPLGAVAVFGASNFPFAFSVAGGDTASALAAGSPVVVKAHGAHPELSAACAELIRDAIEIAGGPADALTVVFGREAGIRLVAHPLISAASLTGSLAAGRALQEVIDAREEPIPLYAELGSINPLVVTAAAAAARGSSIAESLVGSLTGSGGQLCTKPGVVFVPVGPAGDALVVELAERMRTAPPVVLLTSGIRDSFEHAMADAAGATGFTRGPGAEGPAIAPALLEVQIEELAPEHVEERFGPFAVVVRYADLAGLRAALERVPPSLTTTLHVEDDELETARELAAVATGRAGRLVVNGMPTGVRVSWAQHHGGPWPSSNSLHTSVGATAIRRFLRPLAWQDAPEALLPPELRDADPGIPRRVDGTLVAARQRLDASERGS